MNYATAVTGVEIIQIRYKILFHDSKLIFRSVVREERRKSD